MISNIQSSQQSISKIQGNNEFLGKFGQIPQDVVLNIFSYISEIKDYLSLVKTCKYFYRLAIDTPAFDPNIKGTQMIGGKSIEESVFYRAWRMGKLDVVKRLIQHKKCPLETKLTFFYTSELKREPREGDPNVFQWACREGHIDIIKALIKRVDPSADNNLALRLLLNREKPFPELAKALKLLLSDPRVSIPTMEIPCRILNFFPDNLEPIYDWSSVKNSPEITSILCTNPKFNFVPGQMLLVTQHSEAGNKRNVELILNHKIWQNPVLNEAIAKEYVRTTYPFTPWGKVYNPIKGAVKGGHVEIVKFFLNDKRFHASYYQEAFGLACQLGHLEIFKLLLNDPRVNPSCITADTDNFASNLPLTIAIRNDKHEIVNELLSCHEVNVSDRGNEALNAAIARDYIIYVKKLLNHPSFNSGFQGPFSTLNSVIQDGKIEIIKILLKHPQFSVLPQDSIAIYDAVMYKRKEILSLLLADKRFDPAYDNQTAFRFTVKLHQKDEFAEIAAILLKDERVKPSVLANIAIQEACQYGHTEIVRMLLAIPKVHPGIRNNKPIRWASKNGHVDIVKMLLDHPKVNASAADNDALQKALKHNNTEVVEVLLNDDTVKDYIARNGEGPPSKKAKKN